VLLHQQRQGSLKDVSVVRVLNVGLDHLRQQRRLRTVEVVNSSTIGNKTILLNKVKEVLNRVLCDFNERTSGSEKTQNDPVRVPVVGLTEATTCNNEGAVDRDEAVGTIGAVLGVLIVSTGQIRPNVNDFLSEFSNDSVVDVVEELRISIEFIFRDLFELIASIVKVLIEEVSEGRVVAERLLELVESFLDVAQRSNSWPGGDWLIS
jgi:hypothetical protein